METCHRQILVVLLLGDFRRFREWAHGASRCLHSDCGEQVLSRILHKDGNGAPEVVEAVANGGNKEDTLPRRHLA